MKNKVAFLAAAVLIISTLTGCSANENKISKDIFAMDTYMNVCAYGEGAQEAVDDAERLILRLDSSLDAGNSSSQLGILNDSGEGCLDADGKSIMKKALELWDSTGTFDVAIYPVMKLWGFTGDRDNLHVPADEEILQAIELCSPEFINFDYDSGRVSFEKPGMAVDFGGIAKGYASSAIMDIFEEHGIKSGMVSLGGNVQVFGLKPDGSKWKIAIENPEEGGNYLGVYSASDGDAIVTSGGYERNFEEDGRIYHHIIDPQTGYPAESGLKSVTIISKNGTLADGLSTALFIMGYDKAVEYYRNHADEFDVILLDDNNQLFITQGIAGDFSTDYSYVVIK